MNNQYKRILLKLSGESLMGEKQYGIDEKRIAEYATQIKEIADMGIEIGIVIGGGNVAMDVARSSIRLGAKRVRIVYRRRQVDMTAMREEVEGAIQEGCEVLELQSPLRIEKDKDGKAVAKSVGYRPKAEIAAMVEGAR